jgi:coatomer protein complex subunit gamma
LSVKILHVLGDKGPTTAHPNKFIRFIFNRVILETAAVRCAAVSSLAKFGVAVPHLTNHIIILLKRCLMDNDDEVRDRAIFYSNMLSSEQPRINGLMNNARQLPAFNHLEHSLALYLDNAEGHEIPFSLATHLRQAPVDELEQAAAEQKQRAEQEGGLNLNEEKDAASRAAQSALQADPSAVASQAAAQQNSEYLKLFASIPELAELGPIAKSCPPVELTETETEYVVSCVKHILPRHVVFHFIVTNTLEQHQLENVRVEMEPEDEAWVEELSIPEPVLKAHEPGACFVVFSRPADSFVSGTMTCVLHFSVKEVDEGEVEAGDGTADEYQLEEVEVVEKDFMRPPAESMGMVQFRSTWESLGDGSEVRKIYPLGLDSLQDAVNAVTDLLGMQPSESGGVVPEGAESHVVNMSGVFVGGSEPNSGLPVLARAHVVLSKQTAGIKLKIAVRSQNQAISNLLSNAIR